MKYDVGRMMVQVQTATRIKAKVMYFTNRNGYSFTDKLPSLRQFEYYCEALGQLFKISQNVTTEIIN